MARTKTIYQLIADARTRRETSKKRKGGLFQKLNELTTLCDIQACAVVVNGDGAQPEFWPSSHAASGVIQRFRGLPSSSQSNNMIDQEVFMRQALSRFSKNLDKETRKVELLEKELVLADCLNKEEVDLTKAGDLNEMLRLLERKIEMVDRKLAETAPSSSNMAAMETESESRRRKGKMPSIFPY